RLRAGARGRDALDAEGRQGDAEERDPRRQPGDLHGERGALQPQGRGARGGVSHPPRSRRGEAPRPRRDDRRVEPAVRDRPRRRHQARRGRHRRRGRRSPDAAPPRRGPHLRVGPQDRPLRGGGRGLAHRGLRGRDLRPRPARVLRRARRPRDPRDLGRRPHALRQDAGKGLPAPAREDHRRGPPGDVPLMAVSKVILAKLSPTMEEGTIVKWNKNEGDPVKQGDVLAEIETDKANMEMEAQGSGILRKILVPAGGKAPVGSLIRVIAEANEDISKMLASAGAPAAPAAPPPAAPPAAPPSAPAPRVPAAAPGAAGPTITPGEELPVSSMRRTIAKRLAESMFTAPHFYVTVDIGMDAAVALREQLQRGEDVKVTYNDLVVKACAKALTRFPMVNGSWMGEKIVTHREVHVGVAVTIPDGLITPV